MPYVRDSYWRGRTFTSPDHMQAEALHWSSNVAGQRQCSPLGGAAPLSVFETVEARALIPLSETPFVLPRWSKATVAHQGRPLPLLGALELIGCRVDVRSTATMVQVFREGELVKIHAALEQSKRTPASAPEAPFTPVPRWGQTPGQAAARGSRRRPR